MTTGTGLLPDSVTLAVAVELIPMPSVRALAAFLHRNKSEFVPVYRREGNGRERRMLSRADIEKIRAMTLVGAEASFSHSAAHNAIRSAKMKAHHANKVPSLLAGVYKRAMAGHA